MYVKSQCNFGEHLFGRVLVHRGIRLVEHTFEGVLDLRNFSLGEHKLADGKFGKYQFGEVSVSGVTVCRITSLGVSLCTVLAWGSIG